MPKHFKPPIGDLIANEMHKVMHSEEHQRLYKTAAPRAKKEDEKKPEKKSDKKADKGKKDDKKAAKCKHPKDCTCEKKAEKCDKKCKPCKEQAKKAYVRAAIDGFVRVSASLDELELSKSASMALQTLETLIAEAEEVFYAKDKKEDEDKEEEDDKEDDKDKDDKEDEKDKKHDDKNDCGEGMMVLDVNKADEEVAIELDDEPEVVDEEPRDTDITELGPNFDLPEEDDFEEDETIREVMSEFENDEELGSIFDEYKEEDDEDELYV